MIVAVDGPAASGKGTLVRKLADHYDLAFMDTGALYRAVAYGVLSRGLSVHDKNDALRAAKDLAFKIQDQGAEKVLSNPTLREDRIGVAASKVAAMQPVRDALFDLQRQFAHQPPINHSGVILDGRDIGTVIVPDATVKLFVTADVNVRANRRYEELKSKGVPTSFAEVLQDMQARDARDSHTLDRHKEPGYETNILDTSDLTPDQVFEKACEMVDKAR